jgi:hypothetical protein
MPPAASLSPDALPRVPLPRLRLIRLPPPPPPPAPLIVRRVVGQVAAAGAVGEWGGHGEAPLR